MPDGRRFANDSRGFLYRRRRQDVVYADVAAAFPFAIYNRLESGFIGFDFHPDFANNGLFYTVHSERAEGNPATPNFIPPGFTAADVHFVFTEWHARDRKPARSRARGASCCAWGTSSDVDAPLRQRRVQPRGPGSDDYGLLYTSGSDLGFSNGAGPTQTIPVRRSVWTP